MSYVILYQIKREAWLYVLLSHDDFVGDSYYSSELQDQCSKLCLHIFLKHCGSRYENNTSK